MSRKSDPTSIQDRILRDLAGIADILIFETQSRSRNQLVKDGMHRLENFLLATENLKRTDPKHFEVLAVKVNERGSLPLLNSVIYQILRIHSEAIRSNNHEVVQGATTVIGRLTRQLTTQPGNERQIATLLNGLIESTSKEIAANTETVYDSAFGWYIPAVFPNPEFEADFNLSYLGMLNRFLLTQLKLVISNGRVGTFKQIVADAISSIAIHPDSDRDVWNYGHLALTIPNHARYSEVDKSHGIERRLSLLDHNQGELYTETDLSEWEKGFDELKMQIEKLLERTQLQAARELELKIRRETTKTFRYNSLVKVFYSAAAYCHYEKKAEFLKIMLETQQPNWLSQPILPMSPEELFGFFLKHEGDVGLMEHYDEFKDSKPYYEEIFSILLLRALIRPRIDFLGYEVSPEAFNQATAISRILDRKGVREIKTTADRVDHYKLVINRVLSSDSFVEYLEQVTGKTLSEMKEIAKAKVEPFFDSLKENALGRIKKLELTNTLDSRKVDHFVNKVKTELKSARQIWALLKHHDCINEISKSQPNDIAIQIVTKSLVDRAMFFEEWHSGYMMFERTIADHFAQLEDARCFAWIHDKCADLGDVAILQALMKTPAAKDTVILVPTTSMHSAFWNKPYFKPKYSSSFDESAPKSLRGWCEINERRIPIHQVPTYKNHKSSILIIENVRNLLFTSSTDDTSVEITSISDSQELLNAYLNEPDGKLTRDELLTKAEIKISEMIIMETNVSTVGSRVQIPEDKEN